MVKTSKLRAFLVKSLTWKKVIESLKDKVMDLCAEYKDVLPGSQSLPAPSSALLPPPAAPSNSLYYLLVQQFTLFHPPA